jgi:hypothetical protein
MQVQSALVPVWFSNNSCAVRAGVIVEEIQQNQNELGRGCLSVWFHVSFE